MLLCQLDFLTKCKRNGVLPKSFQLRNNKFSGRCGRLLDRTQYRLLSEAIRDIRARISHNELYAYTLYQSFKGENQWEERLRLLYNCMESRIESNKARLRKKYEFLAAKQGVNKPKLESDVTNKKLYVNLTEAPLPPCVENLFSQGPKLCVPNDNKQCKKVIPTIEKVLHNVPVQNRSLVRAMIIPPMVEWSDQQNRNTKVHQLIQTARHFIKQKEYMICKADKAGVPVISKKQDIEEKVRKYIVETHSQELRNNSDLVSGLVRRIKTVAKIPFVGEFLGNVSPPTYTAVPRMFIQLKTHKEDVPIRPLVQNFCSVTRNLEKSLAQKCLPIVTASTYRVSSTEEFLARLPQVIPQKLVMYTIDIKALFPSIPLLHAHMLMVKEFEKLYDVQGVQKRYLYECLDLIRDAGIFQWNQTTYRQTCGVPMGSPLSPAIAEIFMMNIEKEVVAEYNKQPAMWSRYVDDVFILWEFGETELKELLQQITDKHPTIEFTINCEKNGAIDFLDVHLQRQGERIETRVYRKPMAIDNIIPHGSFSYFPHKVSAFRAYVDRAFRVCNTEEALGEEIKYIQDIARKFGYPSAVVSKLVARKLRPNTSLVSEPESELRFIGALPYLGKTTYKMERILRGYGFKIGVRPTPNIFSLTRQDKDESDPLKGPGVYIIPIDIPDRCTNYIGSTARAIMTRIKEHRTDIAMGRENTALGQCVMSSTCAIPKWNDVRRIGTGKNMFELRFRESLEIATRQTCNCNSPFQIPYVWRALAIRSSGGAAIALEPEAEDDTMYEM